MRRPTVDDIGRDFGAIKHDFILEMVKRFGVSGPDIYELFVHGPMSDAPLKGLKLRGYDEDALRAALCATRFYDAARNEMFRAINLLVEGMKNAEKEG